MPQAAPIPSTSAGLPHKQFLFRMLWRSFDADGTTDLSEAGENFRDGRPQTTDSPALAALARVLAIFAADPARYSDTLVQRSILNEIGRVKASITAPANWLAELVGELELAAESLGDTLDRADVDPVIAEAAESLEAILSRKVAQ